MCSEKLQNFSFIVKIFLIIFIVAISLFSVIWYFFPFTDIAGLFQIFFILTLVLGLLLLIILFFWYFQGWRASHFRSNDNPREQHIGIIVVVYDFCYFWKWFDVYLSGIELLIKGLQKHKNRFIVYRCSNPKEFKKIVNQSQTTELWIFGHGKKHLLNFGTIFLDLEYQELHNAPKKTRVIQLHCNHDGGKSLADYLCDNKENCFVSDNVRAWHKNRLDIQTLLEKYYG